MSEELEVADDEQVIVQEETMDPELEALSTTSCGNTITSADSAMAPGLTILVTSARCAMVLARSSMTLKQSTLSVTRPRGNEWSRRLATGRRAEWFPAYCELLLNVTGQEFELGIRTLLPGTKIGVIHPKPRGIVVPHCSLHIPVKLCMHPLAQPEFGVTHQSCSFL